MHALGHDYRLQNDSRGFLCAPEVMIGIDIPPPELQKKLQAHLHLLAETQLRANEAGRQAERLVSEERATEEATAAGALLAKELPITNLSVRQSCHIFRGSWFGPRFRILV